MSIEERNEYFNKIMAECKQLLIDKGGAYAGKEDALANFKQNAARIGLTPFQILNVYRNKHNDAIDNAIKDHPDHPKDVSESFRSRCMDAINYNFLLLCLLKETEGALIIDKL